VWGVRKGGGGAFLAGGPRFKLAVRNLFSKLILLLGLFGLVLLLLVLLVWLMLMA